MTEKAENGKANLEPDSEPTTERSSTEDTSKPSTTLLSTVWAKSTWTPPRCRWDPENPPVFNTWMNILFAFAGCCTVATLYYPVPILNILAENFNVSYETASRIPTLAQSGYCAGLFFLCPLGDLVRRRAFTLFLIFFTGTVWIGLCVTNNFTVFLTLSFICGFTTVTPQIMLPLVGDLSPPHKRAAALSIVVSGNGGGILIARILSGVVTNFVSWRIIYFIALALQFFIFMLLYLFMPDYPETNTSGLSYYRLLRDVIRMLFKHPVLFQSSLIGFCSSAVFTSFWTTLTGLLAGAPYHYSPLIIGLFALINAAGIVLSPIYARTFIDKFVPMFSAIIGQLIGLIAVIIGTVLARRTVAGPILFALLLDAAFQITQIANRSAIYSCEPKARNRVNTAYMVMSFLGQVTGTSAGNRLYAIYGYTESCSLSIGLLCFTLLLLALRGPYEDRWIGWKGGIHIRKRNNMSADGRPAEAAVTKPTDRDCNAQNEKTVDQEKGNLERALDEAAEVETQPKHDKEERSGQEDLIQQSPLMDH